MTTRTLNAHSYANAHVTTYDSGKMILYSYKTAVIIIDTDGWLDITGLYSRTTIKHIGWFMRELGFDYQLAKQLFNDSMIFNIHTGEIKAA